MRVTQGRENMNAQFNIACYFFNAGVDFSSSSTFPAADLFSTCNRYAVYTTDHTSIPYA